MRADRSLRQPVRLGFGVDCLPEGLFVAGVPILKPSCGSGPSGERRPRALEDLNRDLSAVYAWPVDFTSKLAGAREIGRALQRGDLGHAQMVALHLRLPDPPNLAKSAGTLDVELALRLLASGLLKYNDHHWPAKSPGGIGGQFAPRDIDGATGESGASHQTLAYNDLAQPPGLGEPIPEPVKPVEPVKPPEPAKAPESTRSPRQASVAPTVTGAIKAAGLPSTGRIRFVPRTDYNPSEGLKRGPAKGYWDRFGNEWIKGPSRTPGQPFEWDVQLSRTGRAQLGHLSRDGKHINVSMDGKITHKVEGPDGIAVL